MLMMNLFIRSEWLRQPPTLSSDHVITSSAYIQTMISACSECDHLIFKPWCCSTVWNKITGFETKGHGNVSMQKVKLFQCNLLTERDPFWLILFAMSWSHKRSTQQKNLQSQMPSLALTQTFEKAFQSISSILKHLFQCYSLNDFLLF